MLSTWVRKISKTKEFFQGGSILPENFKNLPFKNNYSNLVKMFELRNWYMQNSPHSSYNAKFTNEMAYLHNELNYINGTYVYTYNIDWQDFSDWPLQTEKPTTCCMSYMTSKTPLVTKSWKYQHNYMKNPGDYGFDYSNNHTHLHKFRGKWYVFYHTMSLQHSFNTTAGFRNVCVDEIQVDENTVNIHMGNQTLKGVKQIQPMNPFINQQAETTAATQGVKFTNGKSIGDMNAVTVPNKTGIIAVRGVEFNKVPSSLEIKASGNGIIEVRRDRPDGEVIASIKVGTPQMKLIESQLQKNMTGTMDLCFVLKGNNITFDEWKFK